MSACDSTNVLSHHIAKTRNVVRLPLVTVCRHEVDHNPVEGLLTEPAKRLGGTLPDCSRETGGVLRSIQFHQKPFPFWFIVERESFLRNADNLRLVIRRRPTAFRHNALPVVGSKEGFPVLVEGRTTQQNATTDSGVNIFNFSRSLEDQSAFSSRRIGHVFSCAHARNRLS